MALLLAGNGEAGDPVDVTIAASRAAPAWPKTVHGPRHLLKTGNCRAAKYDPTCLISTSDQIRHNTSTSMKRWWWIRLRRRSLVTSGNAIRGRQFLTRLFFAGGVPA